MSTLGQTAFAASTNEIYYLKGAAYSSDLQKQYSSTPTDIGSSAVVMSVATTFDGRSIGKERVRAWTRNAIVANYYKAGIVKTNYVSLSFGNPNVTMLLNQDDVLPAKTEAFEGIPGVSFFLQGILSEIYELSMSVIPYMNGSVGHTFNDNNSVSSVKINSSDSNLELPATVGYKEGDRYYNGIYNTQSNTVTKQGIGKGTSAYFGYKYIVPKNSTGTLTASAIAQYEVRVFNDPISGIPLIFSATSGKASVAHTISYQP
ncbi:hypothetical protein [Paenibacillus hubeiensis]|uniref:hypothetical protein n=1 Tax=Paenibacillus hubeiensis TaxID=3077330 RepID=UPI0031BAE1B9